MVALDTSVKTDIASDICQYSLKSTTMPLSAITDNMALDPLSLHDRLMSVKPAGLSKNAWAIGAGLNRNVFTDIKNNDSAHPHTVRKLLDFIGLTETEFDAGMKQPEREAPSREVRAPILAFRGEDRPRDIPIVGTAQCADLEIDDDGKLLNIETMEMDMGEVVDYARRTVKLDSRRDVYAIYHQGTSMQPRFEPGELSYVDPRRAPAAGAYVVVQLRRPDEAEGELVHMVLAKRLVRTTSKFVELEQFNPAAIFRIERERIKHMHRIMPWDEVVAF